MPHLPQLWLSEVRSTHAPATPASWPQLVDLGGAQPQVPFVHVAPLVGQACPHPPQLALSSAVDVHAPSQQVWSAAQLAHGDRTSNVEVACGALASACAARVSPSDKLTSSKQAAIQPLALVTPAF